MLPDETIRWVRAKVIISQAANGFRRLDGVVSDITARKEAEEALQQTKMELQEVLAAVPDYIWSGQFDPDGRFSYRYNSPSVERLFGRPAEFFLADSKRWLSIVYPKDRSRAAQAANRLRTGQSAAEETEYRIILPDGTIRWVRDNVVMLPGMKGHRFVNGVVSDITERKQAEETLRESEARFRGIYTGAPVGIVMASPEGRLLHVNPAFCELLGYSEQELLAKAGQEITHPDDLERTLAIRRQIWDRKSPLIRSYEKRYVRKDGQPVWVEVSITLIRDARGQARYSIAHVVDITKRKQAVTALKEREERFRALVEYGFDVIAVVKADATVQFTSASTSRVLGYRPDELVGRCVFELVHPEDLPDATDVFNRLLQTPGKTMVEQLRCRHKDNSWRWIEISGTNRLGQPHVDGIILNYHDITDQKQAENLLQQSAQGLQRRLAAIVESSDDAIIGADLDGTITSWNAAAQRLYNYAAEEILGRSVSILIPRNRRSEMREIGKKIRRGGHVQHFETVRLRKDGLPVEVSITMSPIKNDAGQITGVSAIYRDITERKELEQAFVEAGSREQERIEQDLHDEICRQLAGIGLVWKRVEQSVAARSLPSPAVVGQMGRLLARTIGQARGLIPVDVESNDLSVALKGLGLSMGRIFGISCVVRCQRPVRLANKAVSTHLYRIAQETVGNAIRHGKAARVWIYLGWKNNKLTLRIRDNGSGFSKRQGVKEGMGIRSMRYRTKAVGGSLTLESKRGVGTTVTCVCYHVSLRSGHRTHPPHRGRS